jgi:hypothetical protein
MNCYKREISSEDCQEQDGSEILPLTFQMLSERSSPFFDDEGRSFDQNGQTLHD